MCAPELTAKARSIGKARQEMSIEGVNLNNLKDAPRQLALTTRADFKPLPGISLSRIADTTRQAPTYG